MTCSSCGRSAPSEVTRCPACGFDVGATPERTLEANAPLVAVDRWRMAARRAGLGVIALALVMMLASSHAGGAGKADPLANAVFKVGLVLTGAGFGRWWFAASLVFIWLVR